MPNWFIYAADGTKKGPVTSAQLKALADAGKINGETIIETDSGKKGKAGRVKGLFTENNTTHLTPPIIEKTEETRHKQHDAHFPQHEDPVSNNRTEIHKEDRKPKRHFVDKRLLFTLIRHAYIIVIILALLTVVLQIAAITTHSKTYDFFFSLTLYATPVSLIVWIIIRRTIVIRYFRKVYQESLDALTQNPNDPQLKREALDMGRRLIKEKVLTDIALTQDIDAACAGATIGEGNAHKIKINTSSSTAAQEIDELFKLCKSGVISPEEFEIGKNNILGNDKIDSKARELSILQELMQKGTLSQSEFNMKKWEILSRK